jgi:hypothetical protein
MVEHHTKGKLEDEEMETGEVTDYLKSPSFLNSFLEYLDDIARAK